MINMVYDRLVYMTFWIVSVYEINDFLFSLKIQRKERELEEEVRFCCLILLTLVNMRN